MPNGYESDDVVGYQPNYTGKIVPLPIFHESIRKDVLNNNGHVNFNDSGDWREYIHYSVATNKNRRQPICVALTIDLNLRETIHDQDQNSYWKIDKAVGADFQLDDSYYRNNDWDRGHMARRATAAWGKDYAAAVRASNDTYYHTNACLQHKNINQDEWLEVERWVETLQHGTSNGKIAVFLGPIHGMDGVETKMIDPDGDDGKEQAQIPDAFFKIVSFVDKNGELSTSAYVYLQDDKSTKDTNGDDRTDPSQYKVLISKIEEATGLVFPDILHETNTKATAITVKKEPSTGNGNSDILIDAAYINASEKDEWAHEWISLKNNGPDDANITGWTIEDQRGRKFTFPEQTKFVPAGTSLRIDKLKEKKIRLTNTRGSLILRNRESKTVDKVEWKKRPRDGHVTTNFIRN
eukprot:CAMPEP_0116115606 /NCGR_PEP_ID=MMETSP0329-20121206/594_1 /TAXON_ID=697910 /ORGANISM="Pseudo-nitzschia arenysensis, Strain B593" /LENGTH=407 /DNA_ID=CAMNT_0003609045 /DNA_START=210 /DNA_END=1433 /DNA_ORIENTATION=-